MVEERNLRTLEGVRYVHQRSRRKVEHIAAALATDDPQGATWLDDVRLVHNCLPEVDAGDVDLSTTLCGLRLGAPVLINAMTGGAPELTRVNENLARVAARLGLGIAVGSQTAALENPAVAPSYTVVRDVYPGGTVIANVGAHVPAEWAVRAVEMLRADALQVHLNAAQELSMPEGDRNFSGYGRRLREVVRAAGVPVIAKETGAGVSGEAAERLVEAGVAAIDVGGYGGTNFVTVERRRAGAATPSPFSGWGIPTAVTVVEVVQTVGGRADVVASGGIRTGVDVARCLALGARAVGIARPVLQAIEQGGVEAAEAYLEEVLQQLRTAMVLVGARTVEALRQSPVVLMGRAAEWLRTRGFDVERYARR